MPARTPADPHAWSDDPVLYAPTAGPAEFRPFRGARGPGAPGPAVPDIGRFLRLPAPALVFPFRHDRGRTAGHLRWETAVLSCLSWYWARSRGHVEPLLYHDGVTVEVGPDECVVSIWSVACLLWERFYRRGVPAVGAADDRFPAFYESVRSAVARLRATTVDGVPLLQLLGPARPDKPGKVSDLLGQKWTMLGSVVDRHLDLLRPCGSPEVLLYHDTGKLYDALLNWNEENRKGGDTSSLLSPDSCAKEYVQDIIAAAASTFVVDVARAYDALSAWDFGVFDRMTRAGAKVGGYDRRERAVGALGWQRRRALGRSYGPAHLTVGAWQPGQATAGDRRARPCAVPFLVADVDGPTPDEALPVVRALVGRLVELRVQPADLVVSFTGGRGLHVRIPHGLVGRPLYPRAADAGRIVSGFFERLCDGLTGPCGPLHASLDGALFSPVHLVRAVGSEREENPDRRCVAYRGDEFVGLCDFLEDGFLDVAEARSQSHKPVPFAFPDPDRPAAVPVLVAMLRAAVEDARPRPWTGHSTEPTPESQKIIASVRTGVAPGEAFAPDHAGRNKAAWLYAVYLMTNRRLGQVAAWAELVRWNAEANPVPLGTAAGDDAGELERVFASACRFVMQQASQRTLIAPDEP